MKRVGIWLVVALTLGLAPHEDPHIIGKIKWVAGGANGMELLDWVDLFVHGVPWLILFGVLIREIGNRIRKNT